MCVGSFAAMARGRVFVDLGPIRQSQAFRRLWSGYLVTTLGSQLTVVAVPYQVFRLTHSSFDVGLVGLAQIAPVLAGSLFGGSVADAVDRRLLLILTQVGLAACSLGLALNSTGGHPALWPLYALSALGAVIASVDSPTRSAVLANLVGRPMFASAQCPLAAPVPSGPGGRPCHRRAAPRPGRDRLGLLDRHRHLRRLPPRCRQPSLAQAPRAGHPLRPALDRRGAQLLKGQAGVAGDIRRRPGRDGARHAAGAVPGSRPGSLPRRRGHVGLLYAAPGSGALVGALLTGWVVAVKRQGRAVIVAVGIWGGAIAAFGLVPFLGAALGLLAVAGAADVVSAVFRGTILQLEAPEALRGRLSSVHTAVVTGGPRLGDFEAGAVAALSTAQVSVVSGGLGCLLGVGLVSWLMPRFARYDTREPVAQGALAKVCKARAMDIGILGGTGPAGKALAARLASVGMSVSIGSRSAERGEETAAQLREKWAARNLS